MIGLLGSLLGGRGGRTGGMIGGLAGAFLGGSQLRRLGGMMPGRGDTHSSDVAPGPALDDNQAELLIRAMVNAAKADGHVDDTESAIIMSELGEISPSEQAFMRGELSAPLMPAAVLAGGIPSELRAEAYAVSLIAINVDTMQEAEYLCELSSALGLSDSDRNDSHDDLGVDLL
jgi:uncharacterized membrane protein YebE (DUF533 family)